MTSDLSVAVTCYRSTLLGRNLQPTGSLSTKKSSAHLVRCITSAIEAGLCPSGWPSYKPGEYKDQLEAKAELVRQNFPECKNVSLEVMDSPPSHHRMRAKVGIAGADTSETVHFRSLDKEDVETQRKISSKGICAAMPLLLFALKTEDRLRSDVTMVSFLDIRDGVNEAGLPQSVVACLVYGSPLNEKEWQTAAERVAQSWKNEGIRISLIGQARNQRVVVGRDYVDEHYNLRDGRTLYYRHTFVSISELS